MKRLSFVSTLVAADSDHMIPERQPELVIQAIADVIAARTSKEDRSFR